jgi:hypothetical protein
MRIATESAQFVHFPKNEGPRQPIDLIDHHDVEQTLFGVC